MGFKRVRELLIAALAGGRYQHERRSAAAEKNLLSCGAVTANFVVTLLLRCRGDQYSASAHHFDARVRCHVFRPSLGPERWYVKAYLLGTDAVFISVHRSEEE
ncbi:MAG TPA: hypothetical protein VFQ45_06870 [Longimicrobium sp.]|nr:hypothetical protein [Longimicrobium sp.]